MVFLAIQSGQFGAGGEAQFREFVLRAVEKVEGGCPVKNERGQFVCGAEQGFQLGKIFHRQRSQFAIGTIQVDEFRKVGDLKGCQLATHTVQILKPGKAADIQIGERVVGTLKVSELGVGAYVKGGELVVVAIQLGKLGALGEVDVGDKAFGAGERDGSLAGDSDGVGACRVKRGATGGGDGAVAPVDLDGGAADVHVDLCVVVGDLGGEADSPAFGRRATVVVGASREADEQQGGEKVM